MPRSGGAPGASGSAVTRSEWSGELQAADDLTLAGIATAPGPEAEAAASELTSRHVDAVFAYAAQCTTAEASQATAFLATAAMGAALADLPTSGSIPAWRPHVLARVSQMAAEWSQDERRQLLSAEFMAWLDGKEALPGPDDARSLVATAFDRMPVRFQVALWHLTVESEEPEDVARFLGAEATAVRTWTHHVQDRFRVALIEVHDECAEHACRPFTRILISASQADQERAGVARANSGLDGHLAVCAECAQTLGDLTRLNGPDRGTALAEALLPWGGGVYRSRRTAPKSTHWLPSLSVEAAHGEHRRARDAVLRRLRSVRGQRAMMIPLAACTAVTAIIACVAAPRLVETGHRSDSTSTVEDEFGSAVGGADGSVPTVPHQTGTPSDGTTKNSRQKDRGGRTSHKAEKREGRPPSRTPGPSSGPSTSPHPLAVQNTALRWDFESSRPDPYPAAFVAGASLSTARAGSVTCDGTGYLQSGSAAVDTTRSFTVSLWARLTSTSGFQTAAAQDGDNVSGFFLQYSDEANRWRLAMGHSDSAADYESTVLSTAPPVLNQWQNLTAVFDADTAEIRLYVDGVLQGTDRHAHLWSAAGPFTVGRGMWDGAPSDFWRGGIDDVRAYTRALDGPEIASLATAAPNS